MNLLLWTTHVKEEHRPVLQRLKEAGFDGVEIPLFEGDETYYRKLGQELQNLGLGATAVTVMTPEANPISPDAKVRQAASDRLKWAIQCCAALGASILCGPIHSALGVFSGTGPTADERGWAADVLRRAANVADDAGVRLAVEYLNRFECYFLTTAADTRALVQAVGHPHCQAMYDTFHAHIEEKDPVAAIDALGDDLIHLHVSEGDRGTPGSGQVRWAETFAALKKSGYQGWYTIEAFGRALPELAAATKVWRDLFASAEDVYTQGLAFLRSQAG
ncbi:MAG TPA: sugar phosphate isomerase/epimerase family protein [Gemmatales bacterium]|nr:sugar phosphate isomerase/epimerase family protein [Gemmatales bacterium]HMP58315.1 sugar phosphate isomerase/epimerase family protein [Gemmatales bacterium]